MAYFDSSSSPNKLDVFQFVQDDDEFHDEEREQSTLDVEGLYSLASLESSLSPSMSNKSTELTASLTETSNRETPFSTNIEEINLMIMEADENISVIKEQHAAAELLKVESDENTIVTKEKHAAELLRLESTENILHKQERSTEQVVDAAELLKMESAENDIEKEEAPEQAANAEAGNEEERQKTPVVYFVGMLVMCLVFLLIFLLPQDILHLRESPTKHEEVQAPDELKTPTPLAFPGIVGPREVTEMPGTRDPTPPSRYARGSNISLAIALNGNHTDHWTGIVHSLKAIGIPVKVYTDIESALAHRVVIIYPEMTGANTNEETFQRVTNHVHNGNTVIAFGINRLGLYDTFGFANAESRNDLHTLTLYMQDDETPLDPTISQLNILYNKRTAFATAYFGLAQLPLATYGNNGGAAIVANTVQNGNRVGKAYAIGFDFALLAARAKSGRLTNPKDWYVNRYRPTLDTLTRFLARVYREGEPNFVQVTTSPFGRQFTTLITHDIDCGHCMENTRDYIEMESSLGVNATYFIQTKYVKDWNDGVFFNVSQKPLVQSMISNGMEVASHSVAHSRQFQFLPNGTGSEMYPYYRPFVQNIARTVNATIVGELRVSKLLLELLGGLPVRSFRPGHLSLPLSLPQLLEATNHSFSSSITANQALTHYPYRTMFQSQYQTETSVFEFPVTIEDEVGLPLGDRLVESIQLANNISRHGGLVNMLIHTDTTTHKLDFIREFVEEFRNRSWFPTLQSYGDWWRARDSLFIDVLEGYSNNGTVSTRTLMIEMDHNEDIDEIEGLTLRIPSTWILQEGQAGVSQTTTDLVIIDRIFRNATVLFEVLSDTGGPTPNRADP